jgi:hypothetical protein
MLKNGEVAQTSWSCMKARFSFSHHDHDNEIRHKRAYNTLVDIYYILNSITLTTLEHFLKLMNVNYSTFVPN